MITISDIREVAERDVLEQLGSQFCRIKDLVTETADRYRKNGFLVRVPEMADMRAMLLAALMRGRKTGEETEDEAMPYELLTYLFAHEGRHYIIMYDEEEKPPLVDDVFDTSDSAMKFSFDIKETLIAELSAEITCLPARIDCGCIVDLLARLYAIWHAENEDSGYVDFLKFVVTNTTSCVYRPRDGSWPEKALRTICNENKE